MKKLNGFSGLRATLIAEGRLRPASKRVFLRRSTPEWARKERKRKIELGLIIPAEKVGK